MEPIYSLLFKFNKFYLVKMCPMFVGSQLSYFMRNQKIFAIKNVLKTYNEMYWYYSVKEVQYTNADTYNGKDPPIITPTNICVPDKAESNDNYESNNNSDSSFGSRNTCFPFRVANDESKGR